MNEYTQNDKEFFERRDKRTKQKGMECQTDVLCLQLLSCNSTGVCSEHV